MHSIEWQPKIVQKIRATEFRPKQLFSQNVDWRTENIGKFLNG